LYTLCGTKIIGIYIAILFSKFFTIPKIVIYKFLTFFIYSFDVLKEPPHLHIVKEKGMTQKSEKIWLRTLQITEKGTLTDTDLKLALKIIKLHQAELLESFEKFKEGKKVKRIKFTLNENYFKKHYNVY
jgi:hypothetical protein